MSSLQTRVGEINLRGCCTSAMLTKARLFLIKISIYYQPTRFGRISRRNIRLMPAAQSFVSLKVLTHSYRSLIPDGIGQDKSIDYADPVMTMYKRCKLALIKNTVHIFNSTAERKRIKAKAIETIGCLFPSPLRGVSKFETNKPTYQKV